MLSTQRCTSRAYWRVDMWGLARSRLGKRYREPVTRSIGNQASTELLDCSVISNWTGRPVFFWTIVARCRTFTPEQTSSNRSLTRSQARSLLSIARLKITRSRLDRAISRRTRNGPNVLRLERFLLADEQSLVPRSLASVDRTCRHRGSSATPPSASLYRERNIHTD